MVICRFLANISRCNRRQHHSESQCTHNPLSIRLRSLVHLNKISSRTKIENNTPIFLSKFQNASSFPVMAGSIRCFKLLRVSGDEPRSRRSWVDIKAGGRWEGQRKSCGWEIRSLFFEVLSKGTQNGTISCNYTAGERCGEHYTGEELGFSDREMWWRLERLGRSP